MGKQLIGLLCLLGVLGVRAAPGPLNRPVPFAPEAAPTQSWLGLDRLSADRAEELGFPTVAVEIYRRLRDAPGADRAGLGLALATALLDAGRPAEAQRALAESGGPHGSAWHLRFGLASADLRRFESARSDASDVKVGELSEADRAWYYYLEGLITSAGGDPARARGWFQQADNAAPNSLARARFQLAQREQSLRLGQATEDMARRMAENAARFRGTQTGYAFARDYAVMLDALGRKTDAVNALNADLLMLPLSERAWIDDYRLLIGLIAGAEDGVGRTALLRLIESGPDPEGPDRQRMALQVLAAASSREPARGQYRAELDRLVVSPAAAPIRDHLLLFRAQLAIDDRDYAVADAAAEELRQKFPGSPLQPYALGILTAAAWEQARYRAAATFAAQTRDLFARGPARGLLGVVVAEAWFRAGEYRTAADAYAAVLRAPPPEVPTGDLIYQAIESEIRAGALDNAQTILDQAAAKPGFAEIDRWEAEYNLARALQITGSSSAAFERVRRLLASPAPAGLDPELRGRMAWLLAELAFESRQFELTLQLTGQLAANLTGVAESYRIQIAAMGELLRAKALFKLGRELEATEALRRLRTDFASTSAVLDADLVEAGHDADNDHIVDAENVLLRLADRFPDNTVYAPYALLRAAYLAEGLGQPHDLDQARVWIERMVTKYPGSAWVFQARLLEGDVLRESDQFPQAELVYEHLINNDSQNPDLILARLALADCHNEQASADPSQAERAISYYEDLVERVDAPIDIRVEAGYKLGNLYVRLQRPDEAATTWFTEVVRPFLLDPAKAAALGSPGRSWMARTLLEMGQLLKDKGRADEAREAWQRLIEAGLPGSNLANTYLATLTRTPAKS